MSGSASQAKKEYAKFLDLWKGADTDIPTLKQARAKAARFHWRGTRREVSLTRRTTQRSERGSSATGATGGAALSGATSCGQA
jgi:hypothetical protein